MEETFEMSKQELEKIKVLTQVMEKKISQITGAKKLGISDRQVRNLLKRLRQHGDRSIISKKRGRPSNRSLPEAVKVKALSLVRNHYFDFGPSLANEYLKSEHQVDLSTETLRKWMIEAHLWIPRKSIKKIHRPRERRKGFGELIQIDGSHHDWFEGRSPPCVLMVFIDDSTSMITSMYFAESETLEAYYSTLEKHLRTYGIPLSLYGDKCAVLAPRNQTGSKTEFQRALEELKCKLILASSPQAKGRVERVNRTLQDRLIKELRLKGISTIDDANKFLEEYRLKHNKIFSKKPNEQVNVHRPLEGICLQNVLSIRESRTLTKDFLIQFENTFYQIFSQTGEKLFKGAKIEIRKQMNGKMTALFKGHQVLMKALSEVESPTLDEKQLLSWKPTVKHKPKHDHPYKRKYFIHKCRAEALARVV